MYCGLIQERSSACCSPCGTLQAQMNHATGLIYKYLVGRRKQESLLNGLLYVRSGQREQIKSEMNGVSDNGQRTGAESAQLSHSRQGSHFISNMTRSLNKAW